MVTIQFHCISMHLDAVLKRTNLNNWLQLIRPGSNRTIIRVICRGGRYEENLIS